MTDKIKCSCGYETDWRCQRHPFRAGHTCYGAIKLCHACCGEADNFMYANRRLTHGQAATKVLEQDFILCPGCAFEAAVLEEAQREADAFEAALLTSDKFIAEATREVEVLCGGNN